MAAPRSKCRYAVDREPSSRSTVTAVAWRGLTTLLCDVQVSAADTVLDVRQFLADVAETCHITCYNLLYKDEVLNGECPDGLLASPKDMWSQVSCGLRTRGSRTKCET